MRMWDFIADATVRGGALRMLTIVEKHTRECHVLRADRALRSQDVLAWMQKAITAIHLTPPNPISGVGLIGLTVTGCAKWSRVHSPKGN